VRWFEVEVRDWDEIKILTKATILLLSFLLKKNEDEKFPFPFMRKKNVFFEYFDLSVKAR
jgi:hypothetical protein